jgi:hypothetical protein
LRAMLGEGVARENNEQPHAKALLRRQEGEEDVS